MRTGSVIVAGLIGGVEDWMTLRGTRRGGGPVG